MMERAPTCEALAMDRGQEVALILQRVKAPQQLQLPTLPALGDSGIVPSGHHVSPQALAVVQKRPQFYVAVAGKIGVGSHARLALHSHHWV
jgi:hypothetical protein